MSNDRVEVIVRGEHLITVSREQLAINTQQYQEAARDKDLRPGEPTADLWPLNSKLPSDLVALAETVLNDSQWFAE